MDDLVGASTLRGELLFFPVTPTTRQGQVDPGELRKHIAARLSFAPAAVFVACGTGEFFSLTAHEHEEAVAAAVDEVGGRVPVIAGVGYGTQLGVEYTRRAERAGADGVLVLPRTWPTGHRKVCTTITAQSPRRPRRQ